MANSNIIVQPGVSGGGDAPSETWSYAKAFFPNADTKWFKAKAPTGTFAGKTALTVSMIINLDMTVSPGARYLCSVIDRLTLQDKFVMTWFNSTFRFEVGDTIAGVVSASPTRADKNYHLAFVYDGSLVGNVARAKIYVDGVDSTNNVSGTIPAALGARINNDEFVVCGRADSETGGFNENVIACSIFNKALSGAEVTALYNSGTYADPTADADCLHSWWFGDNSNDTFEQVKDNVGTSDLYGYDTLNGDIITL